MLIISFYNISLQHVCQAGVEADKKSYHLEDDDL